jgi:Flp pilus assembly protein TadD
MDVDIIIKMGFFIGDLHRQIEHLHTKQFNEQQSSTTFTVYRGQGMSKEHFEQMKKTKGGLMAFNNFLSTSKMRDISFNFARQAVPNSNLVAILFVMTIDPSTSTTSFASINDVSYFKDTEDEILFSMHSVFRINDIKSMGENLYQVDLTLTSDNDKDLRVLADRIRKETEGSTGWDQLGQLLLKLGQGEKALQVYEILLKESTEEIEKARIYFQIGWAKDLQGEYDALTFYEKSLKIRQQLLPPNHPDLAKSYNGIGGIYDSMGEYLKALSYYQKDLEISQKSLPPNHPDLALSYNNIGIVYRKLHEYSKALSSYEKALEIQQQLLPPNHPDLGMSYNNIGFLYENMGDYSKARSFYERAVEIGQSSLPSNHPNLQTRKRNLEDVKKKL